LRISECRCQARTSAGRGFTLIEVMVAMAVVAVALPALLYALMRQIDGSAYLRDRTLASWVAANKMSELRLVSASRQGLPANEVSGEVEFARRTWYWWVEQESTELPRLTRVTVRVAVDSDNRESLYTLKALLASERNNGAP